MEGGFKRWEVRERYTHTYGKRIREREGGCQREKGERHTHIHIEIVRDENTNARRTSQ